MIKYSGRIFTESEINWIRQLIADNPSMKRTPLSRLVCQHLNWYQHDGRLKEVRCRVVMLQMQKDGLLELPPPQHNFFQNHQINHTKRTNRQQEINSRVDSIGDIHIELVTQKTTSLWNEYIDRYHYLGFTKLPGAQLRYFVYINNQPIACLGFGAAAWKTEARDQFIGWNQQQREKKLHLIVNNA